jgi:hypothetical protein
MDKDNFEETIEKYGEEIGKYLVMNGGRLSSKEENVLRGFKKYIKEAIKISEWNREFDYIKSNI